MKHAVQEAIDKLGGIDIIVNRQASPLLRKLRSQRRDSGRTVQSAEISFELAWCLRCPCASTCGPFLCVGMLFVPYGVVNVVQLVLGVHYATLKFISWGVAAEGQQPMT